MTEKNYQKTIMLQPSWNDAPTSEQDAAATKETRRETMKKQTLTSVIDKTNGATIAHGYIMQPATKFKGGTVKWYPDKMKGENTIDKG